MTAETSQAAQATHPAMGTVMSHRAHGVQAKEAMAAAIGEISRLEGLLSRFIPESDVSRVNESAGMQSEIVSAETYQVLAKAVEFSRSFPGCFDVTIAPLVGLWHEARATLSQPDEGSIGQALALVDYRGLILNPWERSAGLRCIGQAIDLGGIGKGFAGDKVLDVYRQYDITSAFSNLGGNVVTLGTKPDGSPWQIGIQHPRQEGKLIGRVAVAGQSVVTSGDYQRFYTDSRGKRQHHILDPISGHPAESGLISVSIISASSLAADALSTMVYVAGLQKGLEILRCFPATEAIFVESDEQVCITPGLLDRFEADRETTVMVIDGLQERE